MIMQFLEAAEKGQPVYISRVYDAFQVLEKSQTLHCFLSLLEEDRTKYFPIKIPEFGASEETDQFIKEYVWAELYNILSSLGGRRMDIYIDDTCSKLRSFAEDLTNVFNIPLKRKDRQGYGRAINVIDRMLDTLAPEEKVKGFCFTIAPLSDLPEVKTASVNFKRDISIYSTVTENLDNKILCGVDVGGTDIKIVLVKDGHINCFKEYDWFPASFTESQQLVDPICLIVRLMRAVVSLETLSPSAEKDRLNIMKEKALHISASEELMRKFCFRVEDLSSGTLTEIDSLGMCFPDVVVKNKIVGGEVYKTRGIRNNPAIDYESDFKGLTDLNDRIAGLLKKNGSVHIINDGPMASFTAAVEIAASDSPQLIEKGVFAHTLGTELGTGWVDEKGSIPDIPLEVYNFIIDLGSYPERQHNPDDLRSINNFNTGIPGTLQKYTSQSGIFRLAMKYFPKERPDLFAELIELGFVAESIVDGKTVLSVPTEPEDMRKTFLEHMMALPERENDEVNDRIWKELGEFLAITWLETKKILDPDVNSRVLFGRLVKRKRCFDLMVEGARSIKKDIIFEIADSGLANTKLMKELEADPDFTVAQFAQAIGAVYFANK
ncbi:MAG: hypothetical protein HQ557_12820 [Bacteroidetes bacterium]|nr:hypothetical protein [Bacteroidota bacterium]